MSLNALVLAAALNLDVAVDIASDEVLLGPYDLQNLPSNGASNTYLIASVTATDASPAVFSSATTAPANGTPVLLKGSPAGFTDGLTYYVVNEASTTFELALTPGGTPVTSTASASGIDVYVFPFSPILPVTHAGQGVPKGAGETPFLPNYSAIMFYHATVMSNIGALYVEGSDDKATWYTYATISASGAGVVAIPSLYRYIQLVAYCLATLNRKRTCHSNPSRSRPTRSTCPMTRCRFRSVSRWLSLAQTQARACSRPPATRRS
jgi:hypothetical protein